MTFIVSHAAALHRYQPVFAGAHRVPGGLVLPDDRVVTVNRGGLTGRAEEVLFRRFGVAGRAARDLARFQSMRVHERDIAGLAEALRQFVENPGAVDSSGTAGRSFLAATFGINRMAKGMESLYDRARKLLDGIGTRGCSSCMT